MYKRFREEPELTEIPLTKEGILEDVIRRTDFNAFFAKDNVTETKVYLSGRFRDFNKYGGGVKKYAYNVNSQSEEDGIIEYIFSKIGFYSCFAVEFGGWDGIYLSNIRNLVLNNDMYALFIEGDSEKALEGQKNYNGNGKVKFINEWVHFKNDRKLDDILEENDAPKEIDLSIDIDGYDYWVWDSLKKYRPRVVIIEFNPTVSNSVVMISPVNEEPLYGSSALAMVELGKRKGYELVAVTDCNCIFVVNEEFEKIDITDNSLEYLRRESLRDFALPIMTFRGDVLNGIFGK